MYYFLGSHIYDMYAQSLCYTSTLTIFPPVLSVRNPSFSQTRVDAHTNGGVVRQTTCSNGVFQFLLRFSILP